MTKDVTQSSYPQIVNMYRELRRTHQLRPFLDQLQSQYTEATLLRLVDRPITEVRRAATLALGYVGGERTNTVLGELLHDTDHIVRLLAETSLQSLWPRLAEPIHRERLRNVMRNVLVQNYEMAIAEADVLAEMAPLYAEVRNQRAIAFFELHMLDECVRDCDETLTLNPFHFHAAIAMGHCYRKLGEFRLAKGAFARAFAINPNLHARVHQH